MHRYNTSKINVLIHTIHLQVSSGQYSVQVVVLPTRPRFWDTRTWSICDRYIGKALLRSNKLESLSKLSQVSIYLKLNGCLNEFRIQEVSTKVMANVSLYTFWFSALDPLRLPFPLSREGDDISYNRKYFSYSAYMGLCLWQSLLL